MAADSAGDRFLASVSHELRTPLNGVVAAGRLLAATELSAEQRAWVDLIRSSADALAGLIDEILDLAKLDAGKLGLEPIPFPLRATIAEGLRPLKLRTDAKGLVLTCEVAPDVPDALVGDPARLRQVLVNLVGNAVKFTDDGDVAVRVGVASRDAETTVLHVSVRDTGIGVPAHRQQAIFEAFTQADDSTARIHGGTGLGLAIAARLVALMDGRIWLESEIGRGTTFHFTARVGVQPEQLPAGAATPSLAGLRALVAEPNPAHRRAIGEMLHAWRVEAVPAETGPAALAALDEARRAGQAIDVVLLAVDMLGLDGLAVAERMRAGDDAVPIVMMMRSIARRGDRERSQLLGVAAMLIRPISSSELLDAILAATGAPAEAPAQPPPARAARPLRILLTEDNPVNQAVAIGLLEGWGHTVTVAENGRAALAALERETFDIAIMDVHMPGMDGFAVTAEIRRREAGRRLPIVAMTALAMEGDRERCLAAGMDAYLAKPVVHEELFSTLERLAGDDFDPAALRARVDGDAGLERRIARIFLESAPGMLARLRDAVARGDAGALAEGAHALKSAVGNFPAPAALTHAERLEAQGRAARLGDAPRALAALEDELERLRAALERMLGAAR